MNLGSDPKRVRLNVIILGVGIQSFEKLLHTESTGYLGPTEQRVCSSL